MNYINGFDSDTFFKMLKKWASTATVEKKKEVIAILDEHEQTK